MAVRREGAPPALHLHLLLLLLLPQRDMPRGCVVLIPAHEERRCADLLFARLFGRRSPERGREERTQEPDGEEQEDMSSQELLSHLEEGLQRLRDLATLDPRPREELARGDEEHELLQDPPLLPPEPQVSAVHAQLSEERDALALRLAREREEHAQRLQEAQRETTTRVQAFRLATHMYVSNVAQDPQVQRLRQLLASETQAAKRRTWCRSCLRVDAHPDSSVAADARFFCRHCDSLTRPPD